MVALLWLSSPEKSLPEAFAAAITDQTGKTVWLPDNPKRVISLAPNITELVYALGAQDMLVGRSRFSDYPPQAMALPDVGSYYRPDIESIVALRPDLCIAVSDGTPAIIFDRLSELGIPVFRLNPANLEELRQGILLLGAALGFQEKAAKLVSDMDERLHLVDSDVREALSRYKRRPVVLVQVQASPLIAAGKGTYSGELVVRAGGVNPVRGITPYPRLSTEEILALQPEVILVPGGYDEDPDLGSIPENHGQEAGKALLSYSIPPLSEGIPAARNGRMHALPASLLFRPSLRSLDALETLVPLLFPMPVSNEPASPGKRPETDDSGVNQ